MSTSNPTDRATPRIEGSIDTPEDMIATGTKAMSNIKAGPEFNNAKAKPIQDAVGEWATANSDLSDANKKRVDLQNQLDLVNKAWPSLVRRWGSRRRSVLNAVDNYCDGSKDVVLSFGLGVDQPQPKPEATVPVNVRRMKHGKAGCASTRWNPTPGASGYMVQHATDPTNAATVSAPVFSTAARIHIPATPGTTVHVRVQALDPALPEGQTAFTAWVPVLVGV